MSPEQLQHYYPEFAEFIPQCAYPDCLHLEEDDCAVKQAVRGGRITEDRYRSYVDTFADLEEIQAGHG